MLPRHLLLLAVLAVVAAPVFGSARLTYQINEKTVPVAWPSGSFPLRYTIDRRVIDVVPNVVTDLDRAAKDWSSVPDANISFQSDGVVTGAAAGKDGRNTVTIADDLFANQKFIAMTTNWYDDSGKMIEADMQIDPSAVSGGYNIQQLVEHEMGHMLGLDHSAVLSSIMYPFVGRAGGTSLDSDDRVAIAGAYPRTDPQGGATLQGRVYGDSGGIFAAQVVAVNANGEPVSTGLTDKYGQFTLQGVPPGTYRLYAEPLDGPVDVQNLAGFWHSAKTTTFPTQFADGGPLRVENGRTYGNLDINDSGVARLNPKWIGSAAAGVTQMPLTAMPLSLHPGTTVNLGVGGDGFTGGMTTFDVPSPGFHRISDFTWAGNYVTATYRLDADTAPGSVVILVKSGSESAALTGAVRVEASTRGRAARQ